MEDSFMDTDVDCGATCSSSVFSDDWFVLQELKRRLARSMLRIEQLEKKTQPTVSFLQMYYDKMLCDAICDNRMDLICPILENKDFLPEFALGALSLAYMRENYKVIQELLLFPSLREHVNSRPDLDMTRLIEVAKSDRYKDVVQPCAKLFHYHVQKYGDKDRFYQAHHRSLTINRYPNNLEGNRESLKEAIQSKVLDLTCIDI